MGSLKAELQRESAICTAAQTAGAFLLFRLFDILKS